VLALAAAAVVVVVVVAAGMKGYTAIAGSK